MLTSLATPMPARFVLGRSDRRKADNSRAVVGSREIATRLQEERNLGATGTCSIR